jgi:hypothetical protein
MNLKILSESICDYLITCNEALEFSHTALFQTGVNKQKFGKLSTLYEYLLSFSFYFDVMLSGSPMTTFLRM